MPWPTALAIAAFLLATGKFIDTYHNRSTITRTLTAWARDLLVRFFIFLDDIKPIQIGKYFLNIPWKYQFLLYAPPLCVAFYAGFGVIFLAFLFLGVIIPFDWVYILAIPLLLIQLTVTLLLRIVARCTNDIIVTIILVCAPYLIFTLASLIPNPAANIPNIPGLALAFVWYATISVACLMTSMFYIFSLAVLILKYVTLLLRHLVMRMIDAATNPTIEPFTYFCALFALVVMGSKLTSELLT